MLSSPVPVFAVQIPPSTTYAVTPMKRPMEEDGEEKSPSKKKKKIQKKGIELTRGRYKGGFPKAVLRLRGGGGAQVPGELWALFDPERCRARGLWGV